MAQEIIRQFRHELKYLISESEAEVIKNRIKVIMQTDKHAGPDGYSIRSLYFDDIKDTALVEKDSGVSSRHKYRIRIYNYSDNVIMLERKRKEEQYIQKTSVSMTRAEYDKINKGDYDFLLDREEMLCHDFYVELMSNKLRPVVIVDYERAPYVYAYGDVRVTFDANIRSAAAEEDIFNDKATTLETLQKGTLIMEVKFTEYLPSLIRDMLDVQGSVYVSASKYVMCMEKRNEVLAINK